LLRLICHDRNGTTSGSSHGAEAGAEEKSALNAESSTVFERTIDSKESTVATFGEANLVTEIVHQKITTVTLERVSIPKRYLTSFACDVTLRHIAFP
jgi:hypothetical protein